MDPSRRTALAAALAATLAAGPARAVYLDPDGLGQALIYPYYTVRSSAGDAFNTYVSVVNTTAQAKVVRVRFREGTAGAEALGFNLYLSPRDTWTAAVVPGDDGGARLVSADASCVNPPLAAVSGAVRGVAFSDAAFRADGLGGGIGRTREGYVEVLEMATLTGAPAAALVPDASGIPANCAALQGAAVSLQGATAAPSGGLMGTLTLINIASGMDFTVNAEALAHLASRPYYRDPTDPYPDYSAAEIDRWSEVIADGKRHRLLWSSGLEAVSSVLMSRQLANEYVLDSGTASSSDWIVTFPTRRLQAPPGRADPPFTPQSVSATPCETFGFSFLNRESATVVASGFDFGFPLQLPPRTACASSTAITFANGLRRESVFASTNRSNAGEVVSNFQNGWAWIRFTGAGAEAGLMSLPGSVSRDQRTDAAVTGRFRVQGLPAVGFLARTFKVGRLTCGTSACQGNLGGAYPHHPLRSIVLVP